jgi:hypothetical protein
MRSRKSSQSVFASPGFTPLVKSSMSRKGQSGSFTRMLRPNSLPRVGFTFSAGRSIAMPSRPSVI